MLPVVLPETDDFSPKSFPPDDADSTPEPPLGRLTDWVDGRAGPGRRAEDVPPRDEHHAQLGRLVLVRAALPGPDQRPSALVDPEMEHYWMGPTADRPLGGVDLYVGGVEHAVLHLLYARFWHKVLFDLGYVSSRPSRSTGWSTRACCSCLRYTERATASTSRPPRSSRARRAVLLRRRARSTAGVRQDRQEPEERGHARTSSSRDYGADTFRLFEMFSGPLEQSRPWDAKAIVGPYRLLQRIWRVVVDEDTGDAARLRRPSRRTS